MVKCDWEMAKCDQESEYDIDSKFDSWHLTAVRYLAFHESVSKRLMSHWHYKVCCKLSFR